MNGRKILVADVAEADARLCALFAGAQLRFVRTLGEAQRALDAGAWQLLVIGVHFDDSRMFELLRAVRADARYAGVRVVCVRSLAGRGLSIGLQGLEVAVKALQADAFLDLTRVSDEAARGSLLALL